MKLEAPTTRLSCRPDGCAGLCTDAGLRAADSAYRRRLIARARRVLGDPMLAEEAAQEALVRAWQSCSSFDPAGGPVVSWLLTITRNVAVDMARARARRPPVPRSIPTTEHAAADVVETHEEVLALRGQLSQALACIGAAHRHVVVETLLRDRSHSDVAAELGVPAGTVRSRLHYALRELRTRLEAAEVCA